MIELAERFQQLEREMADEKGPFLLFALFLREGAPHRWDVVVSAPWIAADEPAALKYIAEKIQNSLSADEIVQLSHVALIEPDDPGLKAIQKSVQTRHGLVEVSNKTYFDLPIEHGYILTSSKDAA